MSVKQHTQYKGNYVHCEDNAALVAFPSFVLSLANNKEMHAIIRANPKGPIHYDESKAILSNTPLQHTTNLIHPSIKQCIPKEKRVQFQETVQYKPLHQHAKMPTRATKGSIGYDVYSSTSTVLKPNEVIRNFSINFILNFHIILNISGI